MESMMAGPLPIEALAERVASGGEILEADAQLLLDTPDLIAVGAIADDVRRGLHGTKTTFVRVFKVHVDAPPAALPPRTTPGEIRIVGKPSSLEMAIAAVTATIALGASTPVTGFRLPIYRPWTVVRFGISAPACTTQGSSLLPTCQSICCRIRSQPLARPELRA